MVTAKVIEGQGLSLWLWRRVKAMAREVGQGVETDPDEETGRVRAGSRQTL